MQIFSTICKTISTHLHPKTHFICIKTTNKLIHCNKYKNQMQNFKRNNNNIKKCKYISLPNSGVSINHILSDFSENLNPMKNTQKLFAFL